MADVTLQGTVRLPGSASLKAGTITLTLSANARDSGGDKFIGRQVITIPEGGNLTGAGITLTPNTDLTPASTTYEAVYRIEDTTGRVITKKESWSVGATDPVNIGTLVV